LFVGAAYVGVLPNINYVPRLGVPADKYALILLIVEEPAQLTTLRVIHLSYEFVPATIAF